MNTVRKVFRLKGIGGTLAFIAFVPLVFCLIAGPRRLAPHSHGESVVDVIIVVFVLWLCLSASFTRVIATDEAIERYDCFNRLRYRLRYDLVSLYSFNGTRWYLKAGPGRFHLPYIDFDEFHRLILWKAPVALRAKRWRCGQMPPDEDFKSLCLFDFQNWLSRLVGASIACSVLWLVRHDSLALYILAGNFIGSCVDVVKVFGDLALTSDGASVSYPWRKRSISWADVIAVFCERTGKDRAFVLVSKKASIRMPAHLAVQFEPIQKLFYSLPDGTLCVNFDSNYKRGYRRRKNKKQASAEVELQPAF